ncbi:MAG: recombinase family protein [Acidobacteriota bacterium]
MKAHLYDLVTPADPGRDELGRLEHHAVTRGWEVAESIAEPIQSFKAGRPVYRRLVEEAQAGTVEAILVTSLGRLFPSLHAGTSLLFRWAIAGTPHVVAIDQGFDSATEGYTLDDAFGFLHELDRDVRTLKARVGAVNAALGRRGRRRVPIDFALLRELWRQGLSQQQIADRMTTPQVRVTQGTLSRRISEALEAGRLSAADQEARSQSLGPGPRATPNIATKRPHGLSGGEPAGEQR